MSQPRVLVVLGTADVWSRGILRGFTAVARESGWGLLHYHPSADLAWLAREWDPSIAVLGPDAAGVVPHLRCPMISVNADRVREQAACVLPDEQRIGELALRHFVARGLEHVTTFRFDQSAFAIARERAFEGCARQAGAQLATPHRPGPSEPHSTEDRAEMVSWLRALPRPCGIFTCCDSWGRVVARYAMAAGLRVPEDIALVGADNDIVECELIAPPLSSVAIPWRTLGEEAARLVALALAGTDIAGRRVIVPPVDVVARRSSDVLAIDDPVVADAVAWIGSHATGRLRVPMVARAAACSRQRLERGFRAALGRTIREEIQRVRVESAKTILRATTLDLKDVARQTGFTTAALLNEAFRRELEMTPGVYRRRMRAAIDAEA